MTEDRLLPNAGSLLLWAGAIAAFVGGSAGLANTQPTLILLSVLLLMGYGVVGYLLLSRGAQYFAYALPGAAVLVVATIVLFTLAPIPYFDGLSQYVLHPGLALLLVYAAGALVMHTVETMMPPVHWPGKGAPALKPLLFAAAYAPIWSAWTLLDVVGPRASPTFTILLLSVSILAALGCVVCGYAASRNGHPGLVVVGSGIGFLASAAYLFEFMLGAGNAAARFMGQLHALAGLIVTGLAIAMAAVAWIQLGAEPAAAEPQPADPVD